MKLGVDPGPLESQILPNLDKSFRTLKIGVNDDLSQTD